MRDGEPGGVGEDELDRLAGNCQGNRAQGRAGAGGEQLSRTRSVRTNIGMDLGRRSQPAGFR